MHSTKHARSIMHKYNTKHYYMWTNKNKDHRTVKCYIRENVAHACLQDLRDAGYTCKLVDGPCWDNVAGIIARVYN